MITGRERFLSNYLDGETIFRTYWAMGNQKSWTRMTHWAKANGICSPVTGKFPYKMTLWKAAWRWAWNHQSLAKEIINIYLKDNGIFWDDAQWEREFIEKAANAYQNKKAKKRLENFQNAH